MDDILLHKLYKKFPGKPEAFYKARLYKLKVFGVNLLFFLSLLIFSLLFSVLLEFLILYMIFPLLKPNIGGVHLNNLTYCLITSTLFLFSLIIFLNSGLALSLYFEILLWVISLTILILYVPKGTPNIPFTNPKKNKLRKIKVWLFTISLFILRYYYISLYYTFLLGYFFLLLLVTPIAYRIIK